MPKPELNSIITTRIDLTPELFIIRVVPKGWDLPTYKPGQFAVLGLPGSSPRSPSSEPDAKEVDPNKYIQRAYSIASSPKVRDYIEFYIAHVKSGELTPRLHTLKLNDTVWFSPKITGNFVMDQLPAEQNAVFVATGTGIAPFMSMLNTYVGPDSKRKFALFHGVRHEKDLAYRDELLKLKETYPFFSYFPILSRPESASWQGHKGYVQELWKAQVLKKEWGFAPTPGNTHIYLCGSPSMITDYVALMEKEGFKEDKKSEPGQIHLEKYW
jgi:ferredoxin--NADP+ reductase